MAEEQQQQRVNQAAEQLASAIRVSYQALAERGTSAQELASNGAADKALHGRL